MLQHAAIGDAYGAGFEFEKPEIIAQENTLRYFKQHPHYPEIQARYTDDTQMALALAELMLSGEPWTPERIAEAFVTCFHRDPRRGYSSRFYDVLMQVKSGEALLGIMNPSSNRNGSSMRAFPLGFYADVKEVQEKAIAQARITHDTPEGIAGAQAVALASHYFIYQLGDKQNLGEYLVGLIGGPWDDPWEGEVTMRAEDAVRAAITLIRHENSMSDILKKGIDFGGDVDTVGAISLGIAASARDILNDLPSWMARDLENGSYGMDYLANIDTRLRQKFA